MKDKLGRVLLRVIEKASLFEVNGVNKVDTHGNKHDAASALSVVVSLYASLSE